MLSLSSQPIDRLLEIHVHQHQLRLSLDDECTPPEQRANRAQRLRGLHPILVELLGVMASRGDVEKLRRVYANSTNLMRFQLDFNVVDVTTVVDLE